MHPTLGPSKTVSQLPITVTKHREKQLQKGRIYFDSVSEVSGCSCLALCFCAYDEAERHGGRVMAEQSCSPHGRREDKRKRETDRQTEKGPGTRHTLNDLLPPTRPHTLSAHAAMNLSMD